MNQGVMFGHMDQLTKHVNATRNHLGVLAREIVDTKVRQNAAVKVLAEQKMFTFTPRNRVVGWVMNWLGFHEVSVLSELEYANKLEAEGKLAAAVAEKAVVKKMQDKLESEKHG